MSSRCGRLKTTGRLRSWYDIDIVPPLWDRSQRGRGLSEMANGSTSNHAWLAYRDFFPPGRRQLHSRPGCSRSAKRDEWATEPGVLSQEAAPCFGTCLGPMLLTPGFLTSAGKGPGISARLAVTMISNW